MTADVKYQEKHLLKQIAAGDERAFTALYHQHWAKLYGFALSITNSHDIAEEIVADVFLKLWTGRELITGIRNMDGFLFKVARNKAMDFFRLTARNRRLQQMIEDSLEQAAQYGADQQLLEKETKVALEEAIAQLSPRRKLVFTLSRMEGLTHDQIAERLNLSRQTVKNTISDALHSIQGYLQKKEVDGLVILCFLCHM